MVAMRSQFEAKPISIRPPEPSGRAIERVPHAGSFAWALNPYGACGLGGLDDLARLEPGESLAPRAMAVSAVLAHLRDSAARRDGAFAAHPVLLGTSCDPWQPAEREAHLTRQLLEALAGLRGVELRAWTRSSLVGRDVELLARIARLGKVRVSVVVPGLERRTWMALEPHAPSPERRLMAVGLLARAGIEVGVELSPLVRGVNDSEIAVAHALGRAREAGAGFARIRPLAISAAVRERLLGEVERQEPSRLAGLGRILARAQATDEGWSEIEARFVRACAQAGLACSSAPPQPAASGGPPRQLRLF